MYFLLLVFLLIVVYAIVQTNKKPDSEKKRVASYKNETERIEAEVAERKQRAQELGVDGLITGLYYNNIRYYPSWIKRGAVCSLVRDAVDLKDKRVKLSLKNGRDYIFSFKEHGFTMPDGEWVNSGTLELFHNNKKVLSLDMSLENNRTDSQWYPLDIEAFVEGDWVKDFKELEKRIETERQEERRREQEDPERLKKLKEDFGIE